MPRAAPAPLEVIDATVVYRAVRGDASDAALLGASIAFQPGRMTAIIGPNGAGKSTLLHAALGLVPMLRGEARFFGEPLSAVRRRVAFLPQRESIDWDFPITALEVVRMGATSGLGWWMPAWLDRLRGTREGLRAHAALEAVGMQEFARRPIGELSGGQQQRVFLARALAQEADLLLLDEPFAGVDPIAVEDIQQIVAGLSARGLGVLIPDHNVHETLAITDRAYILIDGAIYKHGTAEELADDEEVRRHYLGESFTLERYKIADG